MVRDGKPGDGINAKTSRLCYLVQSCFLSNKEIYWCPHTFIPHWFRAWVEKDGHHLGNAQWLESQVDPLPQPTSLPGQLCKQYDSTLPRMATHLPYQGMPYVPAAENAVDSMAILALKS